MVNNEYITLNEFLSKTDKLRCFSNTTLPMFVNRNKHFKYIEKIQPLLLEAIESSDNQRDLWDFIIILIESLETCQQILEEG